MIMTKFVKEDFNWDGMYLMYKGNFEGAKMMMDVRPNAHPSWEGKMMPAFVARFKYGNYKPWKTWVNFLVKNTTVEEYMKLAEETSPVQAMETLGYKGKI
jgi:hypothetical protein